MRVPEIAALLIGGLTIAGGPGGPGCAEAVADNLYRTTAVVTGTGEVNRQLGFRICLEDVLVKVSGDPRLIGDPAVARLLSNAGSYVSGFSYRDRLEGTPIHDEQGSYDRPHDLTCNFSPATIDAALRKLGREPWTVTRPKVVVFLGVRRYDESYVLSRLGEGNSDMRASMEAAAARVGVPMLLPEAETLSDPALTDGVLHAVELPALDAATKASGGDMPLAGTLVWSDEALGWIADWRIRWQGKDYHWQIRGVGFDDAFRNGMRGAAQVLSGNGEPRPDQP